MTDATTIEVIGGVLEFVVAPAIAILAWFVRRLIGQLDRHIEDVDRHIEAIVDSIADLKADHARVESENKALAKSLDILRSDFSELRNKLDRKADRRRG